MSWELVENDPYRVLDHAIERYDGCEPSGRGLISSESDRVGKHQLEPH